MVSIISATALYARPSPLPASSSAIPYQDTISELQSIPVRSSPIALGYKTVYGIGTWEMLKVLYPTDS